MVTRAGLALQRIMRHEYGDVYQAGSDMSDSAVLKLHMHLTQYVDQVCIICGSVKVTLCPPTSSIDGVCTCTTPSTHISVDLVIVL